MSFFTVTETQMDEMGILGGLGDLERMIQDTTDSEKIQHKGNDILLLIEKRNNKCNVLKHQV